MKLTGQIIDVMSGSKSSFKPQLHCFAFPFVDVAVLIRVIREAGIFLLTRLKQVIFLMSFFGYVFNSYSQLTSLEENHLPRETVLRVNFIGLPAVGLERSIGQNSTIRPEIGLGWPVYATSDLSDRISYPGLYSPINPFVVFEIRKYYNLQRRILQGKKITHFTGNYTGVILRYNAFEKRDSYGNSDDEVVRDVQSLGFVWGFQKSLWPADLFYINFSVGTCIKTNWMNYTDGGVTAHFAFGMQW